MAFLPTNASQVQQFAVALYGIKVGTATMAQVNNDIVAVGGLNNALNTYYAVSFGSSTTTAVGTSVAANLGLTGTAATDAAAYITAVLNGTPANARGAAIQGVLNLFSTLTTNATFGTAATAWNTKVAAAVAYTGATDAAVVAGAAVEGSIFTLTTDANNVAGTSANDTINASLVYAAAATTVDATSTLTVADQIDGGAGNDTLNVTITGGNGATTFVATNIIGVETLNLRNVSGRTNSLDVSTIAGVTAVNSDRSNSAITLTNLPAGSSFGLIGNGNTINTAAQAVGYATGAKVTDATINLSGGTLGASAITLTGANLLSTTINSTGAANVTGDFVDAATSKSLTINANSGLTIGTIDDGAGGAVRTSIAINATGDVTTGAITSAAATTVAITGTGKVTTNIAAVVAPTITISGSGAVTLGTLNNLVSKVTSTQTGGSLTATLGSLVTQTIVGGAGNDVITTPSLVLTTGSVDGGAGTDTLDLGTNVANANTVTLAAKYTNFETLRVNGTFDASLIGSLTAIELSDATNAITGMTATQAANVTARADIGATTLALATATGTSDVVSITFGKGTTTEAATNAGALTVTGFETLNIKANPGPTAATAANNLTTVASLVGATLNKVNMTGSAVAITNAATTVAATFDASALTGDNNATIGAAATAVKGLTLAGSLASGSSVIGSNFIDTITIGATGAGGSSYSLGAGADAISSTAANLRTNSVYNLIDGGTGTDTLTISDGAAAAVTLVDADFKGLSNIEKITVTSTTTGNQSITTGGFFDTNFKAAGVTFTTTTTTGSVAIDASTFSGATTISSTSGAVTGNVSIQTGSGADKVTVVATSVSAGPVVISTGDGDDTIVGGAPATNFTGGKGNDTMTGGAAVDTFKYANTGDTNTPSASSFDTIKSWTTAADIIDFTGTLTVVANATTAAAGVAAISAGSIATFNAADTTLAQHIAAVEAAITKSSAAANAGTTPTALTIATWNEGADAYLFVSDAVAGVTAGDTLIKLVGVNNTGTFTLTAGNVTALS